MVTRQGWGSYFPCTTSLLPPRLHTPPLHLSTIQILSQWSRHSFAHSLRQSLKIMTSHQLAIAKATFSAGLLRPDPTSLSRDEIASFHLLLNSVVLQCSPINIQVWSYTLEYSGNAMAKWSMRIEMQAMDFGQHFSIQRKIYSPG